MDNIALDIKREFSTSLEKMWDAWTDPKELAQWFSPEKMTTVVDQLDFKVNGEYRIIMKNAEGKEHVAKGVYKSIQPKNELSFTWMWEGADEHETLITVHFKELDQSTQMHFRHERFESEKAKEMHNEGWESTFNKLDAQVK